MHQHWDKLSVPLVHLCTSTETCCSSLFSLRLAAYITQWWGSPVNMFPHLILQVLIHEPDTCSQEGILMFHPITVIANCHLLCDKTITMFLPLTFPWVQIPVGRYETTHLSFTAMFRYCPVDFALPILQKRLRPHCLCPPASLCSVQPNSQLST